MEAVSGQVRNDMFSCAAAVVAAKKIMETNKVLRIIFDDVEKSACCVELPD